MYLYDVNHAMLGREGMLAMLLPGALADQLGDKVRCCPPPASVALTLF